MPPKSNKISTKWVQWWAQLDLFICGMCWERHQKVLDVKEHPCPAHPNCRCHVTPLQTIVAGTLTKDGENGPEVTLLQTGKLPANYITKKEAKKLKWKPKQANLSEVAPGKMIGGDPYRNHRKLLPDANNRVWYEADIFYTDGYRTNDRLYYSNDGLLFVSPDHGETFYEIIRE